MYLRNITPKLVAALADTPVVILHGARQTGKSTLAKSLIQSDYKAEYISLDNATVLALAHQDPTGFLAQYAGPLIIDEVQRAPELLLSIKEQVDRDRRPGRYLLTGSAHVLTLPRLADTLAGRTEILTLWPLSQGELDGVGEGFIDTLFADDLPFDKLKRDVEGSPINDYARRVLMGGYPEPLSRPDEERRRDWFDAYLSTILLRDVRELGNIMGLADLPRLLNVLAARAGGLLNFADLARETGIGQSSFKRYFTLLEALFLVRLVQPWFTNRIKRLAKSPKVYLGDTGLLAHLLDATAEKIRWEPTIAGALYENFVAVELMKQITWSRTRPEIYHFRDYAGSEVDLILESRGGRRIVGIEVKSGATVTAADFKGLQMMAKSLGSLFHRGVILYTGTQALPFGPNLYLLPISALWRLGATRQHP